MSPLIVSGWGKSIGSENQRLRGDAPKPLLVHALGDRLPRSVWDRPKRGVSFPFGEWMRTDLGMLEADVQACRLFDARAVTELWAQWEAAAKKRKAAYGPPFFVCHQAL